MIVPNAEILKEIADLGRWGMTHKDVWHPLVIHFPVALLAIVPVFLTAALFLRKHRICFVLSALILVGLGTGMMFAAVESGESAARFVPRQAAVQETLEEHEELAETSLKLFLILFGVLGAVTAMDFFWARKESRRAMMRWAYVVYLIVYGGASLVLVATAHEGGMLVHQHGVQARLPPAS